MLKMKSNYFQYYSVFKRCLTLRASMEQNLQQSDSSKCHSSPKQLWSTHHELSEYLVKNAVFIENGLVILNKPYGLKKEREKASSNKKQIIIHPSASGVDHLNFQGALSSLISILNIEELNLLKLPERYISGISILSSNETVTKKVKKNLCQISKPYTYLAVCYGIPKEEESTVKLGVKFNVVNNGKKVVFVEKYSERLCQKHMIFPLNIYHRVLNVNKELNTSLIQLTVNRNKWHCLRLYCAARLLSPCLGDWLMAPRLRYINNVPVLVDPSNPITNFTPSLPDTILTALQVNKHDQRLLPLHLHLSQVDFPTYGEHGKKFIAKPPENFIISCQRLGISIPDFYLQNCALPYSEVSES